MPNSWETNLFFLLVHSVLHTHIMYWLRIFETSKMPKNCDSTAKMLLSQVTNCKQFSKIGEIKKRREKANIVPCLCMYKSFYTYVRGCFMWRWYRQYIEQLIMHGDNSNSLPRTIKRYFTLSLFYCSHTVIVKFHCFRMGASVLCAFCCFDYILYWWRLIHSIFIPNKWNKLSRHAFSLHSARFSLVEKKCTHWFFHRRRLRRRRRRRCCCRPPMSSAYVIKLFYTRLSIIIRRRTRNAW